MKTNVKPEIKADRALVAYCGLYCGACGSYLKGSCPGCMNNTKAGWCKIRACCVSNGYGSCADCKATTTADCRLFTNFISGVFGIIFNSNRGACIERIKEIGYEQYASEMAIAGIHSIKRRGGNGSHKTPVGEE
jgi:hypothetical protein